MISSEQIGQDPSKTGLFEGKPRNRSKNAAAASRLPGDGGIPAGLAGVKRNRLAEMEGTVLQIPFPFGVLLLR